MKGRLFSIIFAIVLIGLYLSIMFTELNKEVEEVEQPKPIEINLEFIKPEIEVIDSKASGMTSDIYKTAAFRYQMKMDELEYVQNKEAWFITYRELINSFDDEIDVPERLEDIYSETELRKIYGVVQAEIGDEYSFEQKANVASVIFNRLDKYNNNVDSVLTAGQFSTVASGKYLKVKVSERTKNAVAYAFEIEDTTDGCYYFESMSSNVHGSYADFMFDDGAHKYYKTRE